MLKNIVINFNSIARKYNIYFYASVVIALVILCLSVMPGYCGGINSGIKAHCFAYFVFSFTIGLNFIAKGLKRPLLKAAILAGTYGLLIEIVQSFIPYRNFELMDIIINYSSSLVATIPGAVLIKNRLL
jgi:glycopeptide antibiotics resistance protein